MRSIAIIGYSARLPGAPSSDDVWSVLSEGRCTVGELPEDRWGSVRFLSPGRTAPGRALTRAAAVLDQPFDFDPNYFGISPGEAEQMDPQQRILLELTAEAMAHAGVDPARLDRAKAGVFVGSSATDYGGQGMQDPTLIHAQYILGNTLSILANRISYQWDLRGPSMTVDTACSSSLVALDQARRALESGEIDTAIVAGVNFLVSPVPFIGFSHAGMLSTTGLCQAFSAKADGYVRGEGGVVFVLQAEDVARDSGARIRSRLAGTGVNTAGRTNGITIPSTSQQALLMREVVERFGLDPAEMTYVEAHGTGTPVGDPREASAIGSVYGQATPAPLPIGSAKTNFGHLEPASGLLGLLKIQQILETGTVPASLHAEELNPDIDFDGLNLVLARSPQPLAGTPGSRLVAVNSFGFGGANAHAILAEVPAQAAPEPSAEGAEAFPPALHLTAQSETALADLVARWQVRLAEGAADLATEVANANWNRSRHRHRICLGASSPAALGAELAGWQSGEHLMSEPARATRNQQPVGFVFSGNGAIWSGMARMNYAEDPVFRASFDAMTELCTEMGGPDLQALLLEDQEDEALRPAGVAQPLHLAVQVAITDALAAAGLKPAACLGHSLGEVAANVAAGRLTRAEAMRVVLGRARIFEPLFETGGMAALAGGRDDVQDLITEAGLDIDIAAENSPRSVTVSGPVDQLAALVKAARRKRIAGRVLPVAYPYHGRSVDLLETALRADLADIRGKLAPDIAFYAGFDGSRSDDRLPDAEYWWQNARRPVAFRSGVEAMVRDGIRVIVEISPRTVLRSYLTDTLDNSGLDAVVLDTLDQPKAAARSAGALVRRVLAYGGAVDEEKVLGAPRAYRADPPAAAFERQTFRMTSRQGPDIFARDVVHPLLGFRTSHDAPMWRGSVSVARQPWLADHRVGDRVILPAAAMLELFSAAAEDLMGAGHWELQDVEFLRAVELPAGTGTGTGSGDLVDVELRTTWEASARRLLLEQGSAAGWQLAAVARVFTTPQSETLPDPDPALAAPMETEIDGPAIGRLYAGLSAGGLHYGPAFARASRILRGDAAAHLDLDGAGIAGMILDPTAVDATLHGLASFDRLRTGSEAGPLVPGRVGRLRRLAEGRIAGGDLVLARVSDEGAEAELRLTGDKGELLVLIEGLRLRRMPLPRSRDQLYWSEAALPLTGMAEMPLPALATELARAAEADPADSDVLRAVIGGRLAWDMVAAAAGQGASSAEPDPRLMPALDWLAAEGVIDWDGAGLPALGECPWPDLNALIAALSEAPEDVQEELHATLAAACGRAAPPREPGRRARAALARGLEKALTAVEAAGGTGGFAGKVALAGAVDAGLVAALSRAGALVTRVGVNEDALAAERLQLSAPGLTFAALDDPALAGSFDLLLGADLGETVPAADWPALAALVAPGGAALMLEEEDDLFARMTGLSRPAGLAGRLAQAFAAEGVTLESQPAAAAEHMVLLQGSRAAVQAEGPVALALHGQGAVHDLLAPVCTAGEDTKPALLVLPQVAPAALRDLPGGAPLWLVTDQAQDFAALSGWRRVLANETGRDLRAALITPEAAHDPLELARILATSPEQEIDFSGPVPLIPRVLPVRPELALPGAGDRLVLHAARRTATLDDLAWVSEPRRAPGPGEIEIAVEATALNFRDVMWGQGLIPPEAIEAGFAGQGFGMECAGTILRCGADVALSPGQRVLAFAPQAFASHVTVNAMAVMPLPEDIAPEIATAAPVIFLTADYALTELARLEPEETVLIHGAASGVGLAAVQIAQRIGARIIATAGSPEKRRFLEALGLTEILDSRSGDFDDRARALTGGRGVDVVLNAQAGEAMERGIAALAPFGRFIELGKRDIYANNLIALRAFRDNASFLAVDVDQLLLHKPKLAQRVMLRVATGLADGSLRLPPVCLFEADRVGEAFRLMQRSGHIGKIVVRAPAPRPVARRHPQAPDLSGGWLITGGTGGFGLATAEWLARNGATRLWLTGRGGKLDAADMARLQALGAEVTPLAADVTDAARMGEILREISRDGGLDGVIHAAAVLDDGLFDQTEDDRLEAVLNPKVAGAQLLDRLTRDLPLRHFWMYSSVSARFGNPGQSAYVAANRALEALATQRRAAGLPGLAIGWGPISDTGMLARDEATRQLLTNQLGRLLSASEALTALGRALSGTASGTANGEGAMLTVAPMDWARLAKDLPVVQGPLFAAIDVDTAQGNAEFDLAALIAGKGEAAARKEVISVIVTEVSRIMRAAPGDIDPRRPFVDMGFDSLMAMNLKIAAEDRLGVDVPLRSLTEDLSVMSLVQNLFEGLGGSELGTLDLLAEKHLTETQLSAETMARITGGTEKRTGT